MMAAASKMRARTSSDISTFVLLTSPFIPLHKQKSNGVCSGDSNSYMPVKIPTCVHMNQYYHLPKYTPLLLNHPLSPTLWDIESSEYRVGLLE
jgi:hypothetical protein